MKTILVTGGSGLIGSALKEIANNYDYEFIFVNSKNGDLTNSYDTKGLFKLLNQIMLYILQQMSVVFSKI